MQDFPSHKRIYYRFLGFVYGFTYWTNQHKILGIRINTFVKWLSFGPLLLAWQQKSGQVVLGLTLTLALGILWLYWRAKRVGYNKFVAGETAVLPTDDLTPLPPDQRVSLKASGIFGVSDREEQILMCPAEFWRVPLGDHTIMAQPGQGRFVYQFFNATTIQNIQKGWFIHGITPQSILAVTFLSMWGTEPLSLRTLYQSGNEASQNTKQRTVYLCFDDKSDERAVWHSIVHDAREKRKA